MLIEYNNRVSAKTASMLGSMYMSEMMFQMQDHFASIIELKELEAVHIAEHAAEHPEDFRQVLIRNAEMFAYEYVALYDDEGSYETIHGETAWYRNLTEFIHNIKAGEIVATTGYLTGSGGKYLVLGVPAVYEMANGKESSVLLIGFNVEKLYDYIHIEEMQQMGSQAQVDIILTNGAFVLNHGKGDNTSFFDRVAQYGSFVGVDLETGVEQIETAMASKKSFNQTVTLNGVTQHIYGAPAGEPGDWYFVISMAQGQIDALLNAQNIVKIRAFVIVGLLLFLLFLTLFMVYYRLSSKQMKEIEEARMEAEVANRAKSTFLSNMSHDIRTPMNAIVGFASIVEDNIATGKEELALEALAKMKHSSDYLRSLLGDVLDMSKIESGTLSLVPEPMSLTDAVEVVNTIITVRAGLKNQNYTLDIHNIMHDSIQCDMTRLNQVLINILGNAVKFTPENGNITFEVWQQEPEKKENNIRTFFVVEDDGIGMSREFAATMFESFSREENKVRKIEGTGLGLAISKSLVEMMDGTIEVDSREGEGTRFTVILDFPKAKEVERDSIAKLDAVVTTKQRILLAEDNDFNYDIAEAILQNHGFIPSRAENGQAAVDMYCSNPKAWDLILMDLRMPILNGYEATEKIRAFEEAQSTYIHVPILALSADVFAEDIRHCIEVGMEGHISKPIDIQELLRSIKKMY